MFFKFLFVLCAAVFAVCYAAPKPQAVIINADYNPYTARIAAADHLAGVVYPQLDGFSTISGYPVMKMAPLILKR